MAVFGYTSSGSHVRDVLHQKTVYCITSTNQFVLEREQKISTDSYFLLVDNDDIIKKDEIC